MARIPYLNLRVKREMVNGTSIPGGRGFDFVAFVSANVRDAGPELFPEVDLSTATTSVPSYIGWR